MTACTEEAVSFFCSLQQTDSTLYGEEGSLYSQETLQYTTDSLYTRNTLYTTTQYSTPDGGVDCTDGVGGTGERRAGGERSDGGDGKDGSTEPAVDLVYSIQHQQNQVAG